MSEPLRYMTGEEMRNGDRVRFHGRPAQIEFCAAETSDAEHCWFVRQYGGGVMVHQAGADGPTFIPVDKLKDYEDLQFVARGE